jgi:hypothetical protein
MWPVSVILVSDSDAPTVTQLKGGFVIDTPSLLSVLTGTEPTTLTVGGSEFVIPAPALGMFVSDVAAMHRLGARLDALSQRAEQSAVNGAGDTPEPSLQATFVTLRDSIINLFAGKPLHDEAVAVFSGDPATTAASLHNQIDDGRAWLEAIPGTAQVVLEQRFIGVTVANTIRQHGPLLTAAPPAPAAEPDAASGTYL